MSGIAGYLTQTPRLPKGPLRWLRLLEPIRARGPDDEGLSLVSRPEEEVRAYHLPRSVAAARSLLPSHADPEAWIRHDLAILHARYSLRSPGSEARQPYSLPAARILVAFQGEIFNEPELRAELESTGCRSHPSTDTELLARAFALWGNGVWPRINGYWAAAVYDGRSGQLLLSRDRLGIAPLYVAESFDGLFFGSSASGLAAARPDGARPHASRVRGFIETGLKDFDEATLFEGVRSVRPGTVLEFGEGDATLARAREHRYWDLPASRLSTRDLSLSEAARSLRETLSDAVERRLTAARPIAHQLSSGLDSSAVVALSAMLQSSPVVTYTVSVPQADEEPLTRALASRYRIERTVLTELEEPFSAGAASFARLMEEPVQAPNAYANHAMCRAAKEHGFGVMLSGSGADMALTGEEMDVLPAAIRQMWREGERLDALMNHAIRRYGSRARAAESLAAWMRWAARLPRRALGRRRARAASAAPQERKGAAQELVHRYSTLDYAGRRRFHLCIDLPYYLTSNDRATLGIALAHRQPFLDHRIVELGVRMPPAYLFRRGWSKYLLRVAMDPLLPPEIVWRREKLGFPFPVEPVLRRAAVLLAPAAELAAREFSTNPDRLDFAAELERSPARLWRLASVGLWLGEVI